jgi:hypothetical protein
MKTIVSISLLIWSVSSFAGEHIEKMISYYVSYEADSTLSSTATKVKISCQFSEGDLEGKHELRYGWNGSDLTAQLSATNDVDLYPPVGSYRFQFYYSEEYNEIETDSIEVKPGVVTHIHLYFQHLYIHHAVKKPVIYLYPETTTAVSVDLKTVGALTFTYPLLNNGWNVVAQPDGTLTCNGKDYPYLFWEAEQNVQNPFKSDQFTGFKVAGKDAVAFLEEKLTLIGFNDRERTDFITFWGPQLAANNYTNITFQFNESCNQYANLSIFPQPENINRVYMVWSKTDVNALDKTITPQVLPTLNRSGFDVLEWGGVEIMNVEL